MFFMSRRLLIFYDAPRGVLLLRFNTLLLEPAFVGLARLFRALLRGGAHFLPCQLVLCQLDLGQLRLLAAHEAHELLDAHPARAVVVEPPPQAPQIGIGDFFWYQAQAALRAVRPYHSLQLVVL